jgi:GNAT superfamily N-acetyltransferase
MVTFRKAELTRENAQILRTLQAICLPYDDPYTSRTAAYWIGWEKGKAVAFCAVAPSLRWSDTVYLARAGVLPQYRGQGLQKRMIRVRERWARANGFAWVITDTTENPASSNSLIAAGYKLFEPTAPWANDDSLYWRKRLR